MPKVKEIREIVMPDGILDPVSVKDEIQEVRRGTRLQFESQFILVQNTQTVVIDHDLGEIPWVVDVIASVFSDGANAVPLALVTVTAKTSTDVSVNNATTTPALDHYVQVRAM